MSSAKLVCSQERRPKAITISTPIPIRCFIGTLRTRRILRLWWAKRNMSSFPTHQELPVDPVQTILQSAPTARRIVITTVGRFRADWPEMSRVNGPVIAREWTDGSHLRELVHLSLLSRYRDSAASLLPLMQLRLRRVTGARNLSRQIC
jgi:hypothetical protein